MADDFDFNSFKPEIGKFDYTDKYNSFVDAAEAYATELEDAREGEVSLYNNLISNYLKYLLTSNLDGTSTNGIDGFRCTNMSNAVDNRDYVTLSQLNLASGSVPSAITDVLPGSLNPNSILVVDALGQFITERKTTYVKKTVNGYTAVANDVIWFDTSNGSFTITLPLNPTAGTVVEFADISGAVDATHILTIARNGKNIMSIAENLLINDFPFISFQLVYINSTLGWVITRLQR